MNRTIRLHASQFRSALMPAALLVALAIAPGATRAQDAPQPAQRAVRLALVEGKLQVAQNGSVLSEQASINTPLFEGAQLATAEDGRGEIQFEDGTLARIAPSSGLTITQLRQQDNTYTTELTLSQGLGYFELQPSPTSQLTVRYGTARLTATAFTVLRIAMDTQPGEVAVFSGSAHVVREGVAVDVRAGQSLRLNLNASAGYDLSEKILPDSWDTWNADRDQALQNMASQQTAATSQQPNANNAAWADLDANGNWYNVPDQGYVWSPYVSSTAGWDPYGYGSWTWTPGYGYIWLSSYNWGYLPYQCGLWNYYSFGWGWAPGGCSPWWRGGGWYMNIGRSPGWYHRPERPHPGPSNPRGGPGGPGGQGGQNGQNGQGGQGAGPGRPGAPGQPGGPGDTAGKGGSGGTGAPGGPGGSGGTGGPGRPGAPGGGTIISGGSMSPHPVVPVTRGPAGMMPGNEARTRFAPVNNDGMQLQALRPTASRPGYAQPGSGFAYRPTEGGAGTPSNRSGMNGSGMTGPGMTGGPSNGAVGGPSGRSGYGGEVRSLGGPASASPGGPGMNAGPSNGSASGPVGRPSYGGEVRSMGAPGASGAGAGMPARPQAPGNMQAPRTSNGNFFTRMFTGGPSNNVGNSGGNSAPRSMGAPGNSGGSYGGAAPRSSGGSFGGGGGGGGARSMGGGGGGGGRGR